VTITGRAGLWAVCALALAVIAWLSPLPDRLTDREIYEATAARGIVRDCTDLHCFRVLVAWTIGPLPGPSLVKWKAYAVAANAAAAVAVFELALIFGLTRRASLVAAALSALGFGSLYTLHDVHTSDPLMYALGPLVTLLLLRDRVAVAGLIASIGVLAKEFVAAPLYIVAAAAWIEGRTAFSLRALAAANTAFLVWLLLQLTLIIGFNYGYGDNPSTHLLSGGYLARWLGEQTARGVASAMFNQFGVLWMLAPLGFLAAPSHLRRLALVSLPVAAVFGYVQQPDRALWNFHFLVTPLAALALSRAPLVLITIVVGLFALGNLRVGAQLEFVPAARFALAASVAVATAAVFVTWRRSRFPEPASGVAHP
jgi:hypothetical protein